VIYGVTMQEFGVSKPVGVRMTNEKVSLEDNAPTVAETVRGGAAHAMGLTPPSALPKKTRGKKSAAAETTEEAEAAPAAEEISDAGSEVTAEVPAEEVPVM
jgi:chromosome segregation protein